MWGLIVFKVVVLDLLQITKINSPQKHWVDSITIAKFLFCFSFDVILDPFGGDVGETYTGLLSKWKGAIYVTLAPPLLSKTDEFGAGLGLLSAGQSFTSSALEKVQDIYTQIRVQGEKCQPDAGNLRTVVQLTFLLTENYQKCQDVFRVFETVEM